MPVLKVTFALGCFPSAQRVLVAIMSVLKLTFVIGRFGHVFGHDPELKGIAALADNKHAHLVLTLDMADPRLAELGVDVGAKLRLVHPYYFSVGNTFVYHHLSETFCLDVMCQFSNHMPMIGARPADRKTSI